MISGECRAEIFAIRSADKERGKAMDSYDRYLATGDVLDLLRSYEHLNRSKMSIDDALTMGNIDQETHDKLSGLVNQVSEAVDEGNARRVSYANIAASEALENEWMNKLVECECKRR